MSAASAMGARAEERAARGLGSKRVHRQRGERAPDVMPVRTASGVMLGPESKARARLPHLVTAALAQARGYFHGRAIPIAVLFEKGQRGGIVALDLHHFAHIVGIDVGALPAPTPLRRSPRDPQLALFEAA